MLSVLRHTAATVRAAGAHVQWRCRRTAKGVSIVEMMVGVTIGLFILAAASAVATSQLVGNRDAMVRVQMQQDLRAIADMMTSAMARSGFERGPESRVWRSEPAASYGTVYDRIAVDGADRADSGQWVDFLASSRLTGAFLAEDGVVNDEDKFGFRFDNVAKTVEVFLGGSWQTLSDPQLMRVTDMRIDVIERVVGNPPCGYECESTSAICVWTTKSREYRFRIDAQAVSNPAVKRSIEQTVRSRNLIVALPEGC